MILIPVDSSTEHYHTCKAWLEEKGTTKWLSSIFRYAKYPKLIHEMLITNKKNKLFFISVDNRLVGLVGFSNIDLIDRRAEIWYLVGSQLDRGKNIATQAVDMAKNIAVKDLPLLTLYANVPEPNAASIKVLNKNGFNYVGKYRNAFFVDGVYRDFLIFDWVNPNIE
jgi:RimJ/RimL family protein N-acetyltransferase